MFLLSNINISKMMQLSALEVGDMAINCITIFLSLDRNFDFIIIYVFLNICKQVKREKNS